MFIFLNPLPPLQLANSTLPFSMAQSSQRGRRPRGVAPQGVSPDSLYGSLSWRSIGPANMGGRVSDISLAPGNAKEFAVAFGTGGIFLTKNMGSSFTPIFDHYGTSCIGSVVIADAPPNWKGWSDYPDVSEKDREDQGKAKIIWVGTGEGNGRNSSSWGDGIYRSTNGGESFTNLGLNDGKDIPRLAVNPKNPDECYAAVLGDLWGPSKTRGVYKTMDAGKTWQPSLQINDQIGADDIVMDPQDPNTIYAAMYLRRRTPYGMESGSIGTDNSACGIYRTNDGGKNWKKLSNGLPSQTGRIGLSVYAKNPKILIATVQSDLGGTPASFEDNRSKAGGVFRSEDGGNNWNRVSTFNPRPFYFSKIAIDPSNSMNVYSLGWDVSKSVDGGKTFLNGGSSGIHTDWHAIAIDPKDGDHIIAGCDGGLFQSEDGTKSWDFLNLIAAGEFYNVAVDNSTPYRVMGGLQDNGSWLGVSSTPYGSYGSPKGIDLGNWHTVGGGDGFHVGFDRDNKNIIYSESQGGSISSLDLTTGQERNIQPNPAEGQPAFRFNWNSPFVISTHEQSTLYLGGNELFKLSDGGESWKAISPDLTTHDSEKMTAYGSNAETYCTIVAVAESSVKAGKLWTGSDDGLIYTTDNDGGSWKNVTPKSVNGEYVAMLEASHFEANRAFAAIDGHRSADYNPHVIVTNDGGNSWSDITSNLPPGNSVRCVREDIVNPNLLFVGTETGIYVSLDLGKKWDKLNGPTLPTVGVHDIVLQPDTHDLVIATHGRSIWIMNDVSPLEGLTPSVLGSKLYVWNPKPAKPTRPLSLSGAEGARYYAGDNPRRGAYFDFYNGGKPETVEIKIVNSEGVTIQTLSQRSSSGLNRIYWDMRPSQDRQLQNNGEDDGSVYALPGEYSVTIKIGTESKTVKFQLEKGIIGTGLAFPKRSDEESH